MRLPSLNSILSHAAAFFLGGATTLAVFLLVAALVDVLSPMPEWKAYAQLAGTLKGVSVKAEKIRLSRDSLGTCVEFLVNEEPIAIVCGVELVGKVEK